MKFYYLPSIPAHAEADWRPSVDIYRTPAGWLIKCDLAGVRREDLRIAVAGSRLSIAGVRRDCSLVAGHQAYSMEIAYNRFAREIELPDRLLESSLEITYQDGMLSILVTTERS